MQLIEKKIDEIETLIKTGEKATAQKVFDGIQNENLQTKEEVRRFAQICLELNELKISRSVLEKHISLSNTDDWAYRLAARTDYLLKDYISAMKHFQKALELAPDDGDCKAGLGCVYLMTKEYDKAEKFLEDANQIIPKNPGILTNLALAKNSLGKHEEAKKIALEGLNQTSKNPYLFYIYGLIENELGNSQAAENSFLNAIQIDPYFVLAYLGISNTKKFSVKDLEFIKQTEEKLTSSMPSDERAVLLFALGKMNDDLRLFDKAFDFYRHANILRKSRSFYKEDNRHLEALKKVFTKDFLLQEGPHRSETLLPVFILGMPRSGSTLIEQIISSHPEAGAAGESQEIHKIVEKIFPSNEVVQLTSAEIQKKLFDDLTTLESCSKEYLNAIKKASNSPQAKVITDNNPSNYLYIGLIHYLFPNAVIINTMRNSLDTAISCYFQDFKNIPWSSDFKDIAKEYKRYISTIEHWEKVLPDNTIIHISYDDLIKDQEEVSKKIIKACRLDWNNACLRFFEAQRGVNTASLWQVRQPIYKTSSNRWKNYEKHIQPLIDAMNEQKSPNSDISRNTPDFQNAGWFDKIRLFLQNCLP